MYLIRDMEFANNRIVFYWVDGFDRIQSPELSSLQHAEEWWKTYMFSLYPGEERRRSILDRRGESGRCRRMESAGHSDAIHACGRRATDWPIKVHTDRVPERIKELLSE